MKVSKWSGLTERQLRKVNPMKGEWMARVCIPGWAERADLRVDVQAPLSPCLDAAHSLHREWCAPCLCAGATDRPSCGPLRLRKLAVALHWQAILRELRRAPWVVRCDAWGDGEWYALRLRNQRLVHDVTAHGRSPALYASEAAARRAAVTLAGILGYAPEVALVRVCNGQRGVQAPLFR